MSRAHFRRRFFPVGLSLSLFLFQSCASLYHIQVGDIEADGGKLFPFDLKVDEGGFNLRQAGSLARAFVRNRGTRGTMRDVENIIALFQYGPKTGNVVYSDDFADELAEKILEKCPSGKITGLTSIRESRVYPVISGEIVKVTGFCII